MNGKVSFFQGYLQDENDGMAPTTNFSYLFSEYVDPNFEIHRMIPSLYGTDETEPDSSQSNSAHCQKSAYGADASCLTETKESSYANPYEEVRL